MCVATSVSFPGQSVCCVYWRGRWWWRRGVAGSNYLGGGGGGGGALGGWFINFVSGQTYNVTIGNGGIYGRPNGNDNMGEGQIDPQGSYAPGRDGTGGGNTTFRYNGVDYTVTGGYGGQGGSVVALMYIQINRGVVGVLLQLVIQHIQTMELVVQAAQLTLPLTALLTAQMVALVGQVVTKEGVLRVFN